MMTSLQLRLVENDDTSCDKNAAKMNASLENDDVIIILSIVNIAESRVIDSCDQTRGKVCCSLSTTTLVDDECQLRASCEVCGEE